MFVLESNWSRGAALAEAFFFQADNELKKRLSEQLERQSLTEQLQGATGIRDAELLEYLADNEFQPSAVAALMLVPSIFVAWADGWVTDDEDRAVVAIAVGKGLGSDEQAMLIVRRWLQTRPNKAMWNLWYAYVETLHRTMPPRYMGSLRDEVVRHAESVARTSGGWMGFGKISRAEQKILDETYRIMSEPRPLAIAG